MKWQERSSSAISLIGLEELQNGRNLLAFSAGSDSTALFFLLQEQGIPFDIAIVNYKLRPSSDAEVAYAKELAQKFGKNIYVKTAPLQGSNIEARARQIRYNFFSDIIKEQGYTSLVTAHHLDDLLEWFLMQLTKGAGVAELVGMEPVQKRDGYTLVRPLLLTPKDEIKNYLTQKKIKYFKDESNEDLSYTRNLFRHRFVKELTKKFAPGIAKSFGYLLEDKKLLEPKICSIEQLHIAKAGQNDYEIKRELDRLFKKLDYLLTSQQKEEILRQKEGVIGGKVAFGIRENLLWAAPARVMSIPKNVRESYRKAGIPAPIRPYIYEASIPIEAIEECIQKVRK